MYAASLARRHADVTSDCFMLDSRYDELFIAAKEEAAMVNMMRENGCTAGVDNFEDLGIGGRVIGSSD